MTDTSELEALKARIKELEAEPAPVTGWSGLFSLLGLVPRWLVVPAGVVALAWAALEIYISAQAQILDLQAKRVETWGATKPGHAILDARGAECHAHDPATIYSFEDGGCVHRQSTAP